MSESLDTTVEQAPSPSFRLPLALSLATTVAAAALAGGAVWQLPAGTRVPMHWNVQGKADGFGSRNSLFFIPGLMLGLTLLFLVLPRIEPRRGNLLRSSKAFKAVWLAVIAFFGGLEIVIVMAALGRPAAINTYCLAGMGALFIVLGNYLGKVRSNFVFGIRTPWTLSSELAWNKTHRAGGWLFVVAGLALVALAIAGAPSVWLLGALVGFLILALVLLMTYSYLVWRSDPNKTASSNGVH